MKLRAIDVIDDPTIQQVEDLMMEAFPPEEHIHTSELVEAAKHPLAYFKAFYDDDAREGGCGSDYSDDNDNNNNDDDGSNNNVSANCNSKTQHSKTQFCGFSFWMMKESTAYALFLAVDAQKRSHGYGSAILNCVKDFCKERGAKTLILEAESIHLDPSSVPNMPQRKSRMKFYEKNGFSWSGYTALELGILYDVLICGQKVDNPQVYIDLMNEVFGADCPAIELNQIENIDANAHTHD